MSHPQPPERQPSPSETEKYIKTAHNVALVAVIACPALALLPPRKLDIYTIGLVGATGFSANYLVRESSGRSIWQHVSRQQQQQQSGAHVPSRVSSSAAQELEQSSIIGELQKHSRGGGGGGGVVAREEEEAALAAAGHPAGRSAWKIQRQKDIQEDVEEGKGFGDMIVEQIWEVWNQGKTKDEDSE